MKRIGVIVFGVGGVGQALLRQIVAGREGVAARDAVRFEVLVLADSKSWLWAPEGMTDDEILGAVAAKGKGLPLSAEGQGLVPDEATLAEVERGTKQALTVRAQQKLAKLERIPDVEIVAHVKEAGWADVIVVDVTAQEGMEPALDEALAAGYGVALANKKALAGPWESAQRYFNNRQVRHESTVGGGQPVIATLRYLVDTGDPIYLIEGQLSGTLGFICQCLDEGMDFSQALALAKAKGYTEPDPREDLSGQDVMRKVMILGRMAGWPVTVDDIYVESLYPPSLAHLPVKEFMNAAIALNPGMAERVAAARASGEVLRYVAELAEGKGTVSLKGIAADSPLANLKYIRFQTERYDDESLMIGGKGAGVEMTAAGVLGDMIG
ncbi:MAG TPA: hypothetical protein VLL52_06240, partial [Anaerolineae bacterium]|nr:hypothetical protein [Anaerolineae bacterium]